MSAVLTSFVLTFVAVQHYRDFEKKCRDVLAQHGIAVKDLIILADGKALDAIVAVNGGLAKTVIDAMRAALAADIFVQDAGAVRRKRLLLADMDSTMVEEETLDEVAAHAGLKDKISAITARSMRGEIDFRQSVRERVGMLRGLSVQALHDTAARMRYMVGSDVLIRTMRAHGAHCVLVSGGFTFFTGIVAAHLGFDEHFGNVLHIEGDSLTGTVAEPIQDKSYKRALLLDTAARIGVDLVDTVAVGDGANDLEMLSAAGLGVGYYPKPLLRDAIDNYVLHGDLTALLYAQGYTEQDISF